MEEIRKVEPIEKVKNQKEQTEPYVKEEEIVNEHNDFGKLFNEERQRLRNEENNIRRKQLENQRDYFEHLKEAYEHNRPHL